MPATWSVSYYVERERYWQVTGCNGVPLAVALAYAGRWQLADGRVRLRSNRGAFRYPNRKA